MKLKIQKLNFHVIRNRKLFLMKNWEIILIIKLYRLAYLTNDHAWQYHQI